MRKLSALAFFALAPLASLAPAQEGTYAYLDIPVLGNIFATTVPARVLSLSLDLTEEFGVCFDPILGYGAIKGVGFLGGVYAMATPKTRIGLKGVHYWVEDNNPVTEAFVDAQRYIALSRKLKLRLGVAVGYGTQTIGRGDLSFEEAENRVFVRDGFTARANIDLSWWFPYGRTRRAAKVEPVRETIAEPSVEEKLDDEKAEE